MFSFYQDALFTKPLDRLFHTVFQLLYENPYFRCTSSDLTDTGASRILEWGGGGVHMNVGSRYFYVMPLTGRQ